ncbi:MAG: sigma-70 family RNA polymerase sigma factor [Bryobacteraceae bacterium]|nr:sigma-70 family RNA polymerase sigma factor [Bryobacteraceae bacterium]
MGANVIVAHRARRSPVSVSALALAPDFDRLTATHLDPDLPIVERCLAGDEAAWEQLVKTHVRRIYSLCCRFTGNTTDAQDLTQEVFLRVFRNLKTFRAGEGSFLVWLHRLTRNLLIDHYRRSRADRFTDSLEAQLATLEQCSGADAKTDAVLSGRETNELLQLALAKLSPELREAVVLRDLQGLEYREIACLLRIPEGTVKSRINRGRAQLARVLKRMKVLA